MHTATVLGVLTLVLTASTQASSSQVPLQAAPGRPAIAEANSLKKRPLKGRFLHITDFHPDPHYRAGSTFDSGCHRRPDKDKKKDKGKGKDKLGERMTDDEVEDETGVDATREKEDLAGYWGSGLSDCDSPMSLVNMTFDWLKKEWADEVDFVIWTGDNARHDIDRDQPRTPREIQNLNSMMVDKMLETFPKDVVVVPSLGNNDIYPHNVMAAGPSSVTSGFLRIWKRFIPDDYDHVFERGAYFSAEVIPDRLAVISLNTLFWYDSNTLVDGCRDRSNDPGALQMDWLEVQLQGFRDRGMQVWLSGHVPPHLGVYFENCYLRYGDLSLRYQDTIVGHLYGHMNIDHFFFVDVDELEGSSESSKKRLESLSFDNFTENLPGPPLKHGIPLHDSSRMQIMGRNGNRQLVDALKRDFGGMPGPAKMKLKDYVVINVSPSVIPTYLPGVRVFSYNISEPTETQPESDLEDPDATEADEDNTSDEASSLLEQLFGFFTLKRKHGHRHGKKPKGSCSRPKNEDKPHCTFRRKPRYFSRDSPSRSNKPLSPLGYAQFFLPGIDGYNRSTIPQWELEYTTYKVGSLLPPPWGDNVSETVAQPSPVPLHLLPGYDKDLFPPTNETDQGILGSWISLLENPYSSSDAQEAEKKGDHEEDTPQDKRRKALKQLKKMTPWKMKDLTIPSYVKLARKLVAEKKMWNQFSNFMFVSSGAS